MKSRSELLGWAVVLLLGGISLFIIGCVIKAPNDETVIGNIFMIAGDICALLYILTTQQLVPPWDRYFLHQPEWSPRPILNRRGTFIIIAAIVLGYTGAGWMWTESEPIIFAEYASAITLASMCTIILYKLVRMVVRNFQLRHRGIQPVEPPAPSEKKKDANYYIPIIIKAAVGLALASVATTLSTSTFEESLFAIGIALALSGTMDMYHSFMDNGVRWAVVLYLLVWAEACLSLAFNLLHSDYLQVLMLGITTGLFAVAFTLTILICIVISSVKSMRSLINWVKTTRKAA